DHAAAGERVDRLGPHARVLRDDAVRITPPLDHLLLGLALRRDENEPGALDDLALDVDVTEVVIGNQDGLLRAHVLLPFVVGQGEAGGRPRRCPGSWYRPANSMQPPVSSCPTVDR